MAPRTRSIAFRLLALTGAVLALRHFGGAAPAYTVKGAWEGPPSTLKDLASGNIGSFIKALEPTVTLPEAPGYTRGNWAVTTADGHLGADYTNEFDGNKVKLHIGDDKSWQANINRGEFNFELEGQELDLSSLAWEATKSSNVPDVGDVKLRFNSDNRYELAMYREKLASIAGMDVSASAVAGNSGMTGRLEATKGLPDGGDIKFSVFNQKGKYALADSTQEVEAKLPAGNGSAGVRVVRTGRKVDAYGSYNTKIAGGKVDVDVARQGNVFTYGASIWDLPLAGGEAGVRFTGEGSKQNVYGSYVKDVQGNLVALTAQQKDGVVGYNAKLTRDLSNQLKSDAGLVVGVDQAGVYGELKASRTVGNGVGAAYEASGRVALKGEDKAPKVAQSLKFSNKLGYAQLVHATGDEPKLRLGYEFDA